MPTKADIVTQIEDKYGSIQLLQQKEKTGKVQWYKALVLAKYADGTCNIEGKSFFVENEGEATEWSGMMISTPIAKDKTAEEIAAEKQATFAAQLDQQLTQLKLASQAEAARADVEFESLVLKRLAELRIEAEAQRRFQAG